MKKNEQAFEELSALFFELKQAIRDSLPQSQRPDPNAWMRCETIRFIGEHGSPSMQEIAKHLRVTAPSATSLVGKLQRLGWVERTSSPKDKRTVQIVLSKKGHIELTRYRAQSRTIMQKVFGGLSDNDLRDLRRIFAAVSNRTPAP
ncbi:MAG TPA: MarR family transcriptional regulator [Candidatus Paceibacterota bacterium]|nr:MarR family transcriptional regulator [Candidatus Paceibacterota bacterium]